ncbi:MAG TPA: MATE family efflux transporter [Tepidisphaeraceae bacterium]|nr:MATE family efflux transporter [Tepidisphaeraceae bacterium]
MLKADSPSLPFERHHSAIAELLTLAAPTVAQMASYTLMQFVDTLMLSHVGATEATAASNSGLLAFSIISFGIGVLWVVNTLVSQAFGRKDQADCGRYLWQGIWFGLVMSAALVPLLPVAPQMFRLFGHEPGLVREEATYIQIVLGATVLKMIGTAFWQFLLAIDRPVDVMIATACGVGVNAVAAWAMLFGHFGFRRMGVAGAAWGQNVGVLVETSLLIAFAMRGRIRRGYNVLDWRLRWPLMRQLIAVGVPSGAQITADVLAWSLFSVWVMGQFGITAMAANTFMMRYMVLSFMPAFGISTAITALVGRYIGRGRKDLAIQRANLGFALTATYMVSCGVFFFLGRNMLMHLFTANPQILSIGAKLLVFAAVYQFFDALYITYNGALRGAGDTLVPAIATAVLCWGITVLGGYVVAVHWPKYGPEGPWTVATIYGVILGVFIYLRFRRGKWMAIHLEQAATADTVPDFDALPAK